MLKIIRQFYITPKTSEGVSVQSAGTIDQLVLTSKCFAELRVVDQIPYLRVNAFFSMLLAKSGVSSWLCRSDAACLAAAASANVMP